MVSINSAINGIMNYDFHAPSGLDQACGDLFMMFFTLFSIFMLIVCLNSLRHRISVIGIAGTMFFSVAIIGFGAPRSWITPDVQNIAMVIYAISIILGIIGIIIEGRRMEEEERKEHSTR